MSHGTWLHRLVRPAVRVLARAGATPNQVTTARFATGLAAAGALAAGEAAAGAALFAASMLLDRADGALARLTGQTTPWGHRYDLVVDSLCNAVVFVGLGVGLRAGAYGLLAPAMGFAAGIAVASILLIVMRVEAAAGPRAAELKGAAGFDPDDAMLLVPLAVGVGWSEPLLLAAALGAPLFAVGMGLRFRAALLPR